MLGYYTISWRFAKIPEQILNPLSKVFFPVYSKFQEDVEILKEKFKFSILAITFLLIPFIGFFIIFSKLIILVALGEKWIPATLPLQILLFSIFFHAITNFSHSLFNSLGRT